MEGFACGVFQYSLSNNKWIGKRSRIVTFAKASPTGSNGFYGGCTICQQYLWRNAICRLGSMEWSAVAEFLIHHRICSSVTLITWKNGLGSCSIALTYTSAMHNGTTISSLVHLRVLQTPKNTDLASLFYGYGLVTVIHLAWESGKI